MITIKFQRRGDKFNEIRRRYPSKANAIVDKHTDACLDLMLQLEPEDTGEMKRQTKKVTLGPLTLGIRIGVNYWPFPNYGTVFQEAQPFVEPAVESARRGFASELKEAIRDLGRGRV